MNLFSRIFGGGNYENLAISEYQSDFLKAEKDHTLVDVRTPAEYRNGHLPNAINIPLDQLTQRMNKIPKDKPVVCVCASGSRSAAAAGILSGAEYEQVYNLSGGTTRWMMQKLPLEN